MSSSNAGEGSRAQPLAASTATSAAQANRLAGVRILVKLLERDREEAEARVYLCTRTNA